MRHQQGLYKGLINIMMNKKIKYFQTIHTYISDTVMLHHDIIFLLQKTGLKTIPKWDCILNFFSECPGMKLPDL